MKDSISVSTTNNDQDWFTSARNKLAQAETHRQQGSTDKALSICVALLDKYPKYVGALQTAGFAYVMKRDFQNALSHLVRAVMYCPENWKALVALASTYSEMGAHEMALITIDRAASVAPNEISIPAMRAAVLYGQRDFVAASNDYKKASLQDPRLVDAHYGYAVSCVEIGKYADAVSALKPLIERGERDIRVIFLFAKIPQRFHGLDLRRLAAEATQTKLQSKSKFETMLAFLEAHLNVAEDKVEEAWSALIAANKMAAKSKEVQPSRTSSSQSAAIGWLKAPHSQTRLAAPDPDFPLSLFILGPSCSGKTTLERMIGMLPGVCTGYESPIVKNALLQTMRLSGCPDGKYANLPRELEPQFRDNYNRLLRSKASDSRVFTNTDPGFIYNVLNISATIPNARFIFIKRNPYDNALKILLTFYRVGNDYSYDLRSVWEYIQWYQDMIDLLVERLPNISIATSYEEVVANPEAMISRIADFCGLDSLNIPITPLGNDIAIGLPYRQIMDDELRTWSMP